MALRRNANRATLRFLAEESRRAAQIVLLAAQTVPIPAGPATLSRLYITYTEALADASTDPGVTGYTRIRETPNIVFQRLSPAPADPGLLSQRGLRILEGGAPRGTLLRA